MTPRRIVTISNEGVIQVYSSGSEAAKAIGTTRFGIFRCCKRNANLRTFKNGKRRHHAIGGTRCYLVDTIKEQMQKQGIPLHALTGEEVLEIVNNL